MYEIEVRQAVIEITNRCNLRCPHCASNSGRVRQDEMTLDEMCRVIADLRMLGCQAITLLGGEFVLRSDWYEIAQAVKSAGIALQIATNGILVDERIRRQLLSLDLQTIGVSIDGATPASYQAMRGVDGFAKCRQLVDDLVSGGQREVHVITTFNAKNLEDFDLFVAQLVDMPFVWQIQMAHDGGERFPKDMLMTREQFIWLAEKIASAAELYGERLKLLTMDDFGYFPMSSHFQNVCNFWGGCQAGRRVIGIRANGDVLPCLSLGDRFISANLRTRPLVEIWRDPSSFPGFRDQPECLTGKCARCPFASTCRAGCHAMAFSQTGTLTETTFCLRQVEQDRILSILG